MSTDADADANSHSFCECTAKDEVLACYFQRLNGIKRYAQQKYAIDAVAFNEMFENEFLRERCCATVAVTKMTTKSVAVATTTTPISIAHSKRDGTQKISHYSISHSNNNHTDTCSRKRYINNNNNNNNKSHSSNYSQLRRYARYLAWLAICLVLVNYRIELTKLFMRNIQIYIYPGMRFWRILTLPVIQRFPELTEFYDETCLVSNPLFRVTNLDCTPCADVINVVDLTISTPYFGYLGNNIPHIVEQVNNVNHSIAEIYQLYQRNRKIFRDEAYKVRSTDASIVNLDQLFDVMLNKSGKVDRRKSSHNLWRINRMTPARILRELFPTPKTIPKHAGMDIERYIAFDVNGDGANTYQLPSTDCSNMFVHQVIGSRVIYLQPTSECKDQCRRLIVKLKQNHTLFYDWWYWKPISSPADQLLETTSVSYIGSYC